MAGNKAGRTAAQVNMSSNSQPVCSRLTTLAKSLPVVAYYLLTCCML
jgi:hypothetical protein